MGKQVDEHKYEFVWRNILILAYLHIAAVYGTLLMLGGYTKAATLFWILLLASASTLGITGGAHRLWAHKSYKANLPMRIILITFATLTFQNHIYEWARDHRVHHKFAETDADPHNAKRGFFFAHVGWLMVKKHKDVIVKGKSVDMSDLEQDGVVMFQKKFYGPLVVLGTFIMPTFVPWYFWGEDAWIAWYTATVARYVISVNLVWCINSAAHLYGPKPYDKNIGPTQNPMMLILGFGEGFHNYHHSFPWDYKASEFCWDARNLTTAMINMFAKIGWATDLKTASPDMVRKRALRTGDGTWVSNIKDKNIGDLKRNFVEDVGEEKEPAWGWGDKCIPKDELEEIRRFNILG